MILLLSLTTSFGGYGNGAQGVLSGAVADRGKELAKVYCGTCHLVPAPEVLDRQSWQQAILPWMATLMGVHNGFKNPEKLKELQSLGYIWSKAPLQPDEFNAIATYYQLAAPARLYAINHPATTYQTSSGFRLKDRTISRLNTPAATLVQIAEAGRSLFVGTAKPPRLLLRSGESGKETIVHEGGIPSSLCISSNGLYYADVGSVTPVHERVSRIFHVPRVDDGFGDARLIIGDLPRVADLEISDLNSDGIEDLIICGFGWLAGELLWLEGLRGGGFKRHTVFERAGAVKVIARDVNGDGYPDLLVLMAQALETLYVLYNDGRGEFGLEMAFSEQPAFGFTDFEAADFDNDGVLEIVTVNGDFDYEGGSRPYHGVRVYGEAEEMEEIYFFQMPGSYQVETGDFDGDGDLDIVAVSFTPGFGPIRTPRTVFLENLGGFRFRPWELPHGNDGRWFVATAGDYDADGDEDLLLGALIGAPGLQAPSNRDVRNRFGSLPIETLLLENVFDEGHEGGLDAVRRRAALGQAHSRFRMIPRR